MRFNRGVKVKVMCIALVASQYNVISQTIYLIQKLYQVPKLHPLL
ncbi:hypothetical protein B0I22_1636 [Epilithonimonas xixisoli]|uniref:Uncharacterized protein n=1 Tax=Epilithonimonas xixisoli TaxID=1476462 RepID=A0A4R8I586_9FLAO|nr:hypothetical protein B0I22_1636 [Epilithonimonas xixisoli]